jgi:heme oxygenase
VTIAESVTFSAELRERSRTMHDEAEGAGFTSALLAGELSRNSYASLVAQEWFLYVTLETIGAKLVADPLAGPFLDPRLTRLAGCEADLEFLAGPSWKDQITALPATARYTRRLREVGESWPAGYVAHHYTRFLGDLSGGQIIAAKLRKQFGFARGEGTASYAFPDVSSPKAVKDEYRAKLDALPLTADERSRMIDEVLYAYRLNTAMLADIAVAVGLVTS